MSLWLLISFCYKPKLKMLSSTFYRASSSKTSCFVISNKSEFKIKYILNKSTRTKKKKSLNPFHPSSCFPFVIASILIKSKTNLLFSKFKRIFVNLLFLWIISKWKINSNKFPSIKSQQKEGILCVFFFFLFCWLLGNIFRR